MKSLSVSLYIVTWFTMTFSLVTMANLLVPRSANLVSKVNQFSHQIQHNQYHESFISPTPSHLDNDTLIVKDSKIDLTTKSSINKSSYHQVSYFNFTHSDQIVVLIVIKKNQQSPY